MEFEDEIGRARSRKGICRPVEGRKASGRAQEFRRQNWRERERERERERALGTKLAG